MDNKKRNEKNSKLLDEVIISVKKEVEYSYWFTSVPVILSIIFYNINGFRFFPKDWESLAFWTSVVFIIIGLFVIRRFRKHRDKILAIKNGEYHLWFQYDNGDELIITDNVIIPYTKERIKRKTTVSGVSWGLDHIKSAMEDIQSGSLPFSLLIPNISFTSNNIPKTIYLTQFGGDNLTIFYLDLDEAKVLSININNKRTGNDILMNYPLTKEINFSKEDYSKFMDNVYKENEFLGGGIITQEDWETE